MPRFVKGQSGNPGGRPKVPADIRESAKLLTAEALQIQAKIMRDDEAPPAARIAAAENIINRAYGKPDSNINLKAADTFADVLAAAAALIGRTSATDSAVGEEPAAVRH